MMIAPGATVRSDVVRTPPMVNVCVPFLLPLAAEDHEMIERLRGYATKNAGTFELEATATRCTVTLKVPLVGGILD